MARILYGIHGTGHGHAMRGLTIARRLGGHEFLMMELTVASSGISLGQNYYIRKVGDFMMSIVVTGDVDPESYFAKTE